MANTPSLPGVVDGFDHNIVKNRFLSINPNNPTGLARLKIELLDLACSVTGKKCSSEVDCKVCVGGTNNGDACVHNSGCAGGGTCERSGETCEVHGPPLFLGYIGDPQLYNCRGLRTMFAVTDEPPEYRCWAESLVHIGDCEIAPAQTYGISAESMQSPGLFSAPLIIGTAPKPQDREWMDLVGEFDGVRWDGPNGIVNVNDLVAMRQWHTHRPEAPHVTVVRLNAPFGPTWINYCCGCATDLIVFLDNAFIGGQFPPFVLLAGGYPNLQAGASLADCTGN